MADDASARAQVEQARLLARCREAVARRGAGAPADREPQR